MNDFNLHIYLDKNVILYFYTNLNELKYIFYLIGIYLDFFFFFVI